MGATQNIVNRAREKSVKIHDPSDIKKILICRPNHRLGNLLLLTPLLQEVERIFPNATTDIVVKGRLADSLFKNYHTIGTIFQLPKKPFIHPITYLKNYVNAMTTQYDLVINTTDESSSGRILTEKSKGIHKSFGIPESNRHPNKKDLHHMAQKPILALRDILNKNDARSMPVLDLRLTQKELTKGVEILTSISPNGKKTLCIFTYATGDKMYSKDWWNEIYIALKVHFNEYNIVEILPVEYASQIDFKAPTFYGKNIREVGAVIAACELFIGSDSGIMHLASSVHVPTLGLFNVTDINKYKPYNNHSLAINTNRQNHSDIIHLIKSTLAKKTSKSENNPSINIISPSKPPCSIQ